MRPADLEAQRRQLGHQVRLARSILAQIKSHVAAGERWSAEDEIRDDARRNRTHDTPF